MISTPGHRASRRRHRGACQPGREMLRDARRYWLLAYLEVEGRCLHAGERKCSIDSVTSDRQDSPEGLLWACWSCPPFSRPAHTPSPRLPQNLRAASISTKCRSRLSAAVPSAGARCTTVGAATRSNWGVWGLACRRSTLPAPCTTFAVFRILRGFTARRKSDGLWASEPTAWSSV